ncbi:MAG: CHRD domain-containing protein, partial [Bacteroidota bacterium]|nr:CHRD domain-containing protein [Bacteroidota bacterium]
NTGGTSGVLTATVTLSAEDESNLLGGLMYLNVHDASYPDGEIGGQLVTTTAGETQYFTNTLSSSQQVPTNSSTATGKVTAILDRVTNKVFLTGNFTGLDSAASAGHIHRGLTGTNGPVIVPLSVTKDITGTITGSATVSSSFADSMTRGFTYVNIHNSTHPGGEIRAQLGDLVLPVKLEYFNGYKDHSQVVLIWQSAQELNVKSYEVEQQDEAGSWIKKTAIAAKGGNLDMKYSVNDVPLATKRDYVLYRLKTVDFSGAAVYSSVIKINYTKSQAAFTILQNPIINGSLVLTITGLPIADKAEISIIDFSGRLMKKAGGSTLSNNIIDISSLAKGMYKVVVKVNDTVLQQSINKQ